MKYLFIKSGGYTESYGRKLGGAINDHFSTEIFHFTKSDTTFKLNFIDGEYRIHQSRSDALNPENKYAVMDFVTAVSNLDQYEVIYGGTESNVTDVVSQSEIIEKFKLIGLNSNKQLIDIATGAVLDAAGVIPLVVCVKMNNSVGYAAFLTSLIHFENIQSLTLHESHQLTEDLKVLYADDGFPIRQLFLDVNMSNVTKSFFEEPSFQTTSIAFAKTNQTVEINLFKTSNSLSEEFKSGFNIVVDSDFEYVVSNGKIMFNTGAVAKSGYVTFNVQGQPIYNDVAMREPRETLIFKFAILVS